MAQKLLNLGIMAINYRWSRSRSDRKKYGSTVL